jgi:hypothetical protein
LESDLLPHPATFKTIDVEREVASVRDARKRIRLEPSVLANIDPNSPQASTLRARALPSICAYTLHDVAEGCVVADRRILPLIRQVAQIPVLHVLARYISYGSWLRRKLYSTVELERRKTARSTERFPT